MRLSLIASLLMATTAVMAMPYNKVSFHSDVRQRQYAKNNVCIFSVMNLLVQLWALSRHLPQLP